MFLQDKATGEVALLAPAKVSPDFSVQDVLAWALTKPADEEYDYCSQGDCVIARFLKETGRAADPVVIFRSWRDGERPERHSFDDRIRYAANNSGVNWTLGAFAARLREIA